MEIPSQLPESALLALSHLNKVLRAISKHINPKSTESDMFLPVNFLGPSGYHWFQCYTICKTASEETDIGPPWLSYHAKTYKWEMKDHCPGACCCTHHQLERSTKQLMKLDNTWEKRVQLKGVKRMLFKVGLIDPMTKIYRQETLTG